MQWHLEIYLVSSKVRYTPLGVCLGRGLLPTGSNPTFGDTVINLQNTTTVVLTSRIPLYHCFKTVEFLDLIIEFFSALLAKMYLYFDLFKKKVNKNLFLDGLDGIRTRDTWLSWTMACGSYSRCHHE